MAAKVKDQIIEDRYSLYNGDCCEVIQSIPDDSIGFSVFSPPFASLYSYSDDVRDMGNCKDYKTFFEHFSFLVNHLFRVMQPGRVVAVHCMDLPTYKREGEEIGLRDFSGDIIRCFQKNKFTYHSRHVIWKDPLIAATRTKALGLAHKQLVKDSSVSRMGIPDMIVAFRKPGENPVPIKHQKGFEVYYGSDPLPRECDMEMDVMEEDGRYYITGNGTIIKGPYKEKKIAEKIFHGTNKRSHYIWQRYASPVWMDIRQTKVLPYRQGRESDDEKHICPLQTDVIERCIALWSGKDDIVLTPFMGVGSEIYIAMRNGRRGIGIELKTSYYRQARRNVKMALSGDQKSLNKSDNDLF